MNEFESVEMRWMNRARAYYQSEVRQKKKNNYCILTHICGEGNGNPLQYSCLENPTAEEPGRLQSMGSLGVGQD